MHGEAPARLDRRRRQARKLVAPRHDVRSAGERPVHVSLARRPAHHHKVRRTRRHDRRQRPVADLHQFHRVLGERAGAREHDRNGLAGISHFT